MRIDAHAHMDLGAFQGDPRAYIESCRERGLEAIVLIASMADCLAATERFGDFIIPCARIAMDDASRQDIQRCIDAGCTSIKFIRPAAPYGDERYWHLYDKLEELGKTAVFHTGYLGFHQREERPVRIEDMRAAQIDVIARRFPDLKVLMAHFSNPWWEEAWKVSLSNRNVYADLSGGTANRRSLTMWSETFAPDGELIERSIRKLLYACDSTFFKEPDQAWLNQFRFYDRLYERLNLPEELREIVDRGNAKMLFGR